MREYKELRMMLVALLSSMGYSQLEIADLLSIAPVTVTRDRDLARNQGILGPTIPVLNLSTREIDEISPFISHPLLTQRLREKLEPLGIEHIRVVPATRRPRENGRRVAVAMTDLLVRAINSGTKEPHTIGFTWGILLRTLIESTHLKPGRHDTIRLVPLSGQLSFLPEDARFERARRYSSNRLVRDLARRLGLPRTHAFWLNAPAMITRLFQNRPDALAHAWEMIEDDPTVRAILGVRRSRLLRKGSPLLDKVGTVFTGIGALLPNSISSEFGVFEFTPAMLEELRRERIVGDINGHLLHVSGRPVPPQSRAGRHNQLAVGVSPDELARIAERRRRLSHYPGLGVVLGAAGEQKAPAVLAACRARCINRLVIDTDLAEALLALPARYTAPRKVPVKSTEPEIIEVPATGTSTTQPARAMGSGNGAPRAARTSREPRSARGGRRDAADS